MTALHKIVADMEGREWWQVYWLQNNWTGYIAIRDAFFAWKPDTFLVCGRWVEFDNKDGPEGYWLFDFYGEKESC